MGTFQKTKHYATHRWSVQFACSRKTQKHVHLRSLSCTCPCTTLIIVKTRGSRKLITFSWSSLWVIVLVANESVHNVDLMSNLKISNRSHQMRTHDGRYPRGDNRTLMHDGFLPWGSYPWPLHTSVPKKTMASSKTTQPSTSRVRNNPQVLRRKTDVSSGTLLH